ncbi:hypothetical protein EON66_12290 [archaeon]|nr:MAG: hypothetical protein EON66_12290 [archaeon]
MRHHAARLKHAQCTTLTCTCRLGKRNADGVVCVPFGEVYDDERCTQIFEALAGTLKVRPPYPCAALPNTPACKQQGHSLLDACAGCKEEEGRGL